VDPFRSGGNVPRGNLNAIDRVPRGTETIDPQSPDDPRSTDSRPEDLLAEGLRLVGDWGDETVETLLAFAHLLAQWSEAMNLTAHRDVVSIVRHLILDAAALVPHLPAAERLTDIGSGAGLPGIPLAILRPETEVVSVEPRSKRIYFQKAVARELGLSNLQPVQGRAEDLSPTPSDLVIAQAVGRPSVVLGWMLPWCRVGGRVAIPTSESSLSKELDQDPRVIGAQTTPYRAPLGSIEHVIWSAQKV
jgi:16S rRNA (guanine(527)-N(7))-methyltransferase RsmG